MLVATTKSHEDCLAAQARSVSAVAKLHLRSLRLSDIQEEKQLMPCLSAGSFRMRVGLPLHLPCSDCDMAIGAVHMQAAVHGKAGVDVLCVVAFV